MKKRILSLLLALVLLLQSAPVSATAVPAREPPRPEAPVQAPLPTEPEVLPTEPQIHLPEPEELQAPPVQPANVAVDFAWTLEEGILTITGNGDMPHFGYYASSVPWHSSRSEITSVILEAGITSISKYAFISCTALTSAELPDGLTSIAESAFDECSKLTSINFPAGLTTIGRYAFENCSALTEVILPDGVTSIDTAAFRNCKSLTSLTLPDSLTTIGDEAFYYCSSLASVSFPASLTTIGDEAFYHCSSLASVSFPASLTSIGADAFYYCTALASAEFSEGLNTIGSTAFGSCASLTSVTLPDGLTSLGRYAFTSCSALESVVFPDSLTVIDEGTLEACHALTSVDLPDHLVTLGSYAFEECTSLASIELPDTLTIINGRAFYRCRALTSIVLPEGLTTLGNDVFESCTGLVSAVVPGTLREIGGATFGGCTSLASVELSDELTVLGGGMFSDCTSLTSIELPDGVSKLLSYTFDGCTALASVVLPDRLTSIGRNAFSDCKALTSIEFPDTLTSISGWAFMNCTSLTSIVLPDSLTSAGYGIFMNCTSLTSAVLPNHPNLVGEAMFENCKNLSSVELPDGLTVLPREFFYGCTSLALTELPDTLITIAAGAFYNCTSLVLTELPAGVTEIHGGAFHGCPFVALTELPAGITNLYGSTFAGCTSLALTELPAGLTTIGSDEFYGCSALALTELPAGITEIGWKAFYGCTSLALTELPAGVTEIGNEAFYGCTSLALTELPAGVTAVGDSAFQNCTSLHRMTIPDGLTEIGDNMFAGCTGLTSAVLPASLLDGDKEMIWGDSSMGFAMFKGCTALTTVEFPEGIPCIANAMFSGCTALALTELPDTLISIGQSAFHSCSSLALSELPDTISNIGSSAFHSCSSLALTELPEGITRIHTNTFRECDSLTTFTIPETVTTIDEGAFVGCNALSKVVIPMQVESIYRYAFNNCPNLTIHGYAGSYAEEYAAAQNLPFVSLGTYVKPDATMLVKDPSGRTISEGFRVEWYQDGSLIGSGSVLQGSELEGTYICRVILEDELLTLYYPPEEISFEAGEEEVLLECVLRSIPRLTLSGRVLDDTGAGIPATIQITQTFHDILPRTHTITAAGDGTFSWEAAAVPTMLLFRAEGFRDQTLPMTLTGLTGNCDLGQVQMVKLPDARVMLELQRQDALRPGTGASQTQLTDFEGWSFTVYNVTRNTAITDFTVQYPDLIPAVGLADPGDTLRIGAENPDAGIICEPVEIRLNELAAGHCVLRFLQKGSFVLDEILGKPQSRILIFDAAGVPVGEDLTHMGWRSMDLPAGSYQVILLEPTELLGLIQSPAILDEYGLTEGQDYARLDVTIEDGSITVIDQVQVPRLDESRLFYTDSAKTDVKLSTNSTFAGKYVLLRVEYAIREEYSTSAETVCIQLPEGLQAADGSLTVDNQPVPFTVEDGAIRVRVGKPQAVIRLYLLGLDIGTFPVDAKLSFDLDGSPLTQPLGSAELELAVATIRMPERTSSHELILSGMALPNSSITIYDSQTPLKTVTSNNAGFWSAAAPLDNPYSYVYHNISVGVTHENLPQELRSEPKLVIYDSSHVEPLKVTMYTGIGTVVFDFRNPTTDPYYVYGGNHISFVVELNRNDDPLIDQVYVITSNDNKQTTYIRCAYDSAKNAWVGAHNYSGSADAPIGLDVQIIMKDAVPPELEEEFVKDLEQEYQQILDAFDQKMEQTRAELEKEIVLPDLKGMTIDEVISYTKELQSDTQALQKETEDTLRRNLQAKGFVIEKTDSGKRVSNGTKGISYQEERLDHVDQEELRRKGYDPMSIPGWKPMYIKTDDNTVDIVDPNTKSRIICELESYMGDEVDFNDPSSLLSYKSMAEDFKKYFYGEIKAPDNYYERQWKKLTKNNIRTQISMQDLDEKIFDLKQMNADPDLIRNYENQYDYLRSLEALQSDELGDLAKQVRNMDLLESLDLFDFVSLGLSAQSLGESIDKGATLRLVYSSLLSTCADNEQFQRLDHEISTVSTCMNVAATGGVVIDTVSIFATGLNPLVGALLGAASFGVQKLADHNLNKEYDRIGNKLKTLDCDGDGIPDYLEELGLPMEKHVAIDPSGYVYEAVPSNRLEGVRAEVYYQGYPLDEYGVPSEEPVDILWDAENYDQVNPQYTDAEGRYHWDVPIGLWLVKYSKEGYLDTDSSDDPAANADGYLPVPPPQLEVNVGMVSTAPPRVESLNVYQDQVQVIFSQYMKPATVRLNVSCGGQSITGRLEPANAEYNEEQTEQFATVFNFIPDTELRGTAAVTISDAVNYAGTKMTANFSETKTVTLRPSGISMAQEGSLLFAETLELKVQILPAAAGANKTLTVTSSAPGLVDVAQQSVTTDSQGTAAITVIGTLPSSAAVTVRLDGTDLEASTQILVELPTVGTCERVTSSIPTGSTVDAGTRLELFTATEGAEIYYTLDGTCPCVVGSPSRLRYTDPIELTEDTFLIAYAVKKGLADSPTAGFMYTVKQKPVSPFTDVPEGSFYQEPVLWAVSRGITNGTTPTTFSPNDQCMRAHVVTFLWRAVGSPEPEHLNNPFVDVKETDFYYKAVLWAVENGITSGMDAAHFGPTSYCNRAQVVTFLYRAMGSPAVKSEQNPFTDVPAASWYTAPVAWAVENGITNGLSATQFGPNTICNRAQIVTFLYRAVA